MTLHRTILALVSLAAFARPARAQQSCESLASLTLRGIRITSAVSVLAGDFTVPGSATGAKVQVPAFCRVAATIDKEVRIELWMPQH